MFPEQIEFITAKKGSTLECLLVKSAIFAG